MPRTLLKLFARLGVMVTLLGSGVATATNFDDGDSADQALSFRYGGVVGATNTYLSGDEQLGYLYNHSFGPSLGLVTETMYSGAQLQASLAYQVRALTHGYLGDGGAFKVHYVTLTTLAEAALGHGFACGGGLSLGQAVRTDLGADLDEETRAELTGVRRGPVGFVGALLYRYDLAGGETLLPELTLDESLTSARVHARVRYETWTVALGFLLP